MWHIMPSMKICIMLIGLLFISGCAMRTSVEVSGGFLASKTDH